jgi:hypothetical protein
VDVLFPQTSSILDLLHGTEASTPVLKKNQIETSLREVSFSVSLKGNLVGGKIDLLFEEGHGGVIEDYRTDDVLGEALDQRS